MLKRSTSRSRRPEAAAKLRLAARVAVAAAVGVWVVYQLGVFVDEARLEPPERLKLGRKSLVLAATMAERFKEEEMERVEDYEVEREDDEDEGMDLEPPLEEDEPQEADESGNSMAIEPGEA